MFLTFKRLVSKEGSLYSSTFVNKVTMNISRYFINVVIFCYILPLQLLQPMGPDHNKYIAREYCSPCDITTIFVVVCYATREALQTI